jgi:DMSO/TMAO reductase YedYZ molybdopterin-dependent catalytic subunit
VAELVDAADPPPETTHLLVHGTDDYRACVAIRDAMDALLAYECDGDPIGDGQTRLVGPNIDSARSVRGVRRLECVSLDGKSEVQGLEPT